MGTGEAGTRYFRSALGSDLEYDNVPDKTAAAHREPGVFTTGDIGYLDDDGYLWLSDRKIDMIISGGVNIYPAEIETVLAGHPAVADVAVIGVPDDEFGEQVKAVVQLVEGTEPSEALAEELVTPVGRSWPATSDPRPSTGPRPSPAPRPASSSRRTSAPPTGRAPVAASDQTSRFWLRDRAPERAKSQPERDQGWARRVARASRMRSRPKANSSP